MGTVYMSCILLGLVSHSILISNALEQRQYFVDPGVTLVERWDGWGTSLAWWADVLGGLDEDVITAVTQAFFHPDNLNLNIVRYVIGGTTPNETVEYPCGEYRTGSATESYKDGRLLDYNWTRDARQRKILIKAKDLGVNTFEAFSNSPPQWMTISGCAKGNQNDFLLHGNLAAEKADEFADYATEVIKYFHENFGVTFTTYAPFNEPYGLGGIGSWFGFTASQEGCNMNRKVMAAVVRSVHKAITDKNLDFVSITTADETQVQTALQTQEYLRNQGLSSMISKVNVHGYWDMVGNRRDLLNILCYKEGHRLWMDEMGWAGTPVGNMTQGLEIASRIVKDVREMLPSAWVYWQAMEGIGSWGLISLPYEGRPTVTDIQYNSGYYAMMQFSKFIKEGYKIIYNSDPDSISAIEETSKTLVIVTINSGMSPISKTFDLRLLSTFGQVSATRTSVNQANVNENTARIDDQKILYVDTAAESVTTLVISNATLGDGAKSNLLINGDFESDVPAEVSKWIHYGVNDGGLTTKFPWRGHKSFYIGSTVSCESRLSQVVQLPQDNQTSYQLFLSAWCSTSGSDTKLSVDVIGRGVSSSKMVSGGIDGYRMYGITLRAKGGDKVDVRYDSFDGISYIDNVILHFVEVEPENHATGGCTDMARGSLFSFSFMITAICWSSV